MKKILVFAALVSLMIAGCSAARDLGGSIRASLEKKDVPELKNPGTEGTVGDPVLAPAPTQETSSEEEEIDSAADAARADDGFEFDQLACGGDLVSNFEEVADTYVLPLGEGDYTVTSTDPGCMILDGERTCFGNNGAMIVSEREFSLEGVGYNYDSEHVNMWPCAFSSEDSDPLMHLALSNSNDGKVGMYHIPDTGESVRYMSMDELYDAAGFDPEAYVEIALETGDPVCNQLLIPGYNDEALEEVIIPFFEGGVVYGSGDPGLYEGEDYTDLDHGVAFAIEREIAVSGIPFLGNWRVHACWAPIGLVDGLNIVQVEKQELKDIAVMFLEDGTSEEVEELSREALLDQ